MWLAPLPELFCVLWVLAAVHLHLQPAEAAPHGSLCPSAAAGVAKRPLQAVELGESQVGSELQASSDARLDTNGP